MCSHTLIEKKIHLSEVEIDVLGLEKEDGVYYVCGIHGDKDCECPNPCDECDELEGRYIDWENPHTLWLLMRN